MKKGIFAALLAVFIIGIPARSVAWGKRGHEMVAEIAFHFLEDSTQKIVKKYLGNLSIGEAANWMDDERGNSYYNYMRTWHYLDIDKGQNYTPSSERNILTVLHSALVDLRQYKTNKRKDIKRDLLLIFHLVGDLHQPLHTGYAIDKGGNDVQISSALMSGNLHSIWDSQIIEYLNITTDSCLRTLATLSAAEVTDIKKVNELKWMYQSRSFLDSVYSFQNNALDNRYMNMAGNIIRIQLVRGGLRLFSILHEVFDDKVVAMHQTDGFINSLQIYKLMLKFCS
ncbi:MAG: S1/P1 nuclease [Ferruginibacter sp.]